MLATSDLRRLLGPGVLLALLFTAACGVDDSPTATDAVVPPTAFTGTGDCEKDCEPPPPPKGGEGCTPGYWKNHLDSWAATGFSPDQTFASVWSAASGTRLGMLTLYQATRARGGGYNALARHATAGLLSAAHPGVSYDLTVAQLIAGGNDVLSSTEPDAIENAKDLLEQYNEQGCPLN